MRERDTWQYRVIERTKGNSTPLGALVLAVIGRNAKNPPWFGRSAEIMEDGSVWTSITLPGKPPRRHVVGSVQFLTETFSRLADEVQLDDKDRIELFRCVRQWCARDHRANITLDFTAGRRK